MRPKPFAYARNGVIALATTEVVILSRPNNVVGSDLYR